MAQCEVSSGQDLQPGKKRRRGDEHAGQAECVIREYVVGVYPGCTLREQGERLEGTALCRRVPGRAYRQEYRRNDSRELMPRDHGG